MDLSILWALCPLVFLAGLVDSIAGGGGLIALTAYAALGLPPTMALGNNKFSSTCGTTIATYRYIRSGKIDWTVAIAAFIFSLAGSTIGSRLALYFDGVYLQYLLLFLVPCIATLTLVKPNFGQAKGCKHKILVSCLTGLVLGCYDGFFGPGTGMFLTWIFSAIIGLELIKACGTSRVVNLASNIAALFTFAINGNIDYKIGIPCAFCSIAGSYIGSGLALEKGAKIVRPMLIVVLSLLMIKVVLNLFHVNI
ncbi:MAG: TSUP family transporter [Sphaerochaetaceae bacterium]